MFMFKIVVRACSQLNCSLNQLYLLMALSARWIFFFAFGWFVQQPTALPLAVLLTNESSSLSLPIPISK